MSDVKELIAMMVVMVVILAFTYLVLIPLMVGP